jgi:DNA-binding NarL/FixJ family response regulator
MSARQSHWEAVTPLLLSEHLEATSRQIEVLERAFKGQIYKVIARELGITERTVQNHVRPILQQYGGRNLRAVMTRIWGLTAEEITPVISPIIKSARTCEMTILFVLGRSPDEISQKLSANSKNRLPLHTRTIENHLAKARRLLHAKNGIHMAYLIAQRVLEKRKQLSSQPSEPAIECGKLDKLEKLNR